MREITGCRTAMAIFTTFQHVLDTTDTPLAKEHKFLEINGQFGHWGGGGGQPVTLGEGGRLHV